MLFCFQTTVRFLAFKTKSTHSIVWNDCFSLKEWGNWEFNLISTKLISVFRVRYCMVLVFKCLKILFSMTPLLLETSYVFILHASVLSVNFFCKLKCRVFFLSFFFFPIFGNNVWKLKENYKSPPSDLNTNNLNVWEILGWSMIWNILIAFGSECLSL